jgi:hypothetical protein
MKKKRKKYIMSNDAMQMKVFQAVHDGELVYPKPGLVRPGMVILTAGEYSEPETVLSIDVTEIGYSMTTQRARYEYTKKMGTLGQLVRIVG